MNTRMTRSELGQAEVRQLQLMEMIERRKAPPAPVMSDGQFFALPRLNRVMLTCNAFACGKVVSTHGMLCVEHTLEMSGPKKPTNSVIIE